MYQKIDILYALLFVFLQAYYLVASFPVERAEVKRIGSLKKNKSCVKVFELANYAVNGLVYECTGNLNDLANCVARACMVLQERNIPFNVLIADCGLRVFLFPQVNFLSFFYYNKNAWTTFSQYWLQINEDRTVFGIKEMSVPYTFFVFMELAAHYFCLK